MAAGDIINNQGVSIIEAGSQPTWTPVNNQSKWAKEEGLPIFYFFDTNWQKLNLSYAKTYTGSTLIDNGTDLGAQLQALETAIENISNDGNSVNVVRTNSIEDVQPTLAEVPNPQSGDTANISLTSQKVEYWSFVGSAWTKSFVVDYSQMTIPVQTVSNTNSIDLTISANDLQAALNLDANQDNEFEIIESVNGVRISKNLLTAFNSIALAQASSSLAVGDAYILTKANLDGVPSDGATSPVLRKI